MVSNWLRNIYTTIGLIIFVDEISKYFSSDLGDLLNCFLDIMMKTYMSEIIFTFKSQIFYFSCNTYGLLTQSITIVTLTLLSPLVSLYVANLIVDVIQQFGMHGTSSFMDYSFLSKLCHKRFANPYGATCIQMTFFNSRNAMPNLVNSAGNYRRFYNVDVLYFMLSSPVHAW